MTTEYNMKDKFETSDWTSKNGPQIWMKDGLYYRLDGPAIIWPNGKEYWFSVEPGNRWCKDVYDWVDEMLAHNHITSIEKEAILIKYTEAR